MESEIFIIFIGSLAMLLIAAITGFVEDMEEKKIIKKAKKRYIHNKWEDARNEYKNKM